MFTFTGIPEDSSLDDPNRVNDLRSRLDKTSSASPSSTSVHDRLGKRDKSNTVRHDGQVLDARDEIERSKQRARKNRLRYREDGYEENGVYHDIYRAADDDDACDNNKIKIDPDGAGTSGNRRSANSRRSPYSDDESNSSNGDEDDEAGCNRRSGVNSGRNNIKSRLGKVNSSITGHIDLRDKLRNQNKGDGDNDKRNQSRRNGDTNVKKERVDEDDRSRLNLCIEIKQEPDEMEFDF